MEGRAGSLFRDPSFWKTEATLLPEEPWARTPQGWTPSLEPPRGLGAWPGGPVWSGTPAPSKRATFEERLQRCFSYHKHVIKGKPSPFKTMSTHSFAALPRGD